MWPGECGTSSTRISVDLRSVVDPGVEQTDKARAFKRRAAKRSGALEAAFPPWQPRRVGAVGSWAFVECMGIWPPPWIRLRPGATMPERFAWYPVSYLITYRGRYQPLPPGSVDVTASWQYVGHGEPPRRPRGSIRRPVTATAVLQLTGVDPGTPSVPELVDRALAEPELRAWVEAHPDGEHWSADVYGWSEVSPLANPRWRSLVGRVPNGFAEVVLSQDEPNVDWIMVTALLDPWTGELLDLAYQCGSTACPTSPSAPEDPAASASP
jgi:hypothetical protein